MGKDLGHPYYALLIPRGDQCGQLQQEMEEAKETWSAPGRAGATYLVCDEGSQIWRQTILMAPQPQSGSPVLAEETEGYQQSLRKGRLAMTNEESLAAEEEGAVDLGMARRAAHIPLQVLQQRGRTPIPPWERRQPTWRRSPKKARVDPTGGGCPWVEEAEAAKAENPPHS